MSSPMRVVHLVPALFDADDGILGGAERYALELARHMAQVVPTRLVTFGPRDRLETEGPLQIRVIGSPWYIRNQPANPFALRLLPELARADVIHCHQQHIIASTVGALAGRVSGRRVFVSELGGGGWDVSGYVSTDRWYHGHLHISAFSRRAFGHESYPWAHVIWGGVDTLKFSPDDLVRRDGTVLFVGRLLPHKGVNDLIDAASADMPLELIGQPYDRRFLADLHAGATGKRVLFRHDCADDELVRSYRKAMCIVLPSVYKTKYGQETPIPELLGQSLLEGMACGTPGVCTAVASMPEVVEDGVTGLVVPPNNPATLHLKLMWLRDHPLEAARMGQAARRRVLERFTWPAVVARCLEIYRN